MSLDLHIWTAAQGARWTEAQTAEVRAAVLDLAVRTPYAATDIAAHLPGWVGAEWTHAEVLAALSSMAALQGAVVSYRFGPVLKRAFEANDQGA